MATDKTNVTLTAEEQKEYDKRAKEAKGLKASHSVKLRTDEGKAVFAFFKKPTREVVTQVMARTAQVAAGVGGDMIEGGEIVLRTGWIDKVSDQIILEDEDLLIAASLTAYGAVNIKIGDLEKL